MGSTSGSLLLVGEPFCFADWTCVAACIWAAGGGLGAEASVEVKCNIDRRWEELPSGSEVLIASASVVMLDIAGA